MSVSSKLWQTSTDVRYHPSERVIRLRTSTKVGSFDECRMRTLTCVDIFCLPTFVRICASCVDLRRNGRIWVYRLPEGEQSVHVASSITVSGCSLSRVDAPSRVMKPENRVKARVGYVAHVPSVADQHMDTVMHIFNAVVVPSTLVRIANVGKRPILRLLGDQLVGQVMQPSDGLEITSSPALPLDSRWPVGLQLHICAIRLALARRIGVSYRTVIG